MKVLFLDFDGVLNSHQSATFWHNKRDQSKWENEMYSSWHGTLKEYIAHEFCPIAMSNMEEICRRVPELKIVISSTWRIGETVETLKKILQPSSLIADKIIGTTPISLNMSRGEEINEWMNRNIHLDIEEFVIVDDDRDMMPHQMEHFVNTSALHGFTYGDMLWALRVLKEGQQN